MQRNADANKSTILRAAACAFPVVACLHIFGDSEHTQRQTQDAGRAFQVDTMSIRSVTELLSHDSLIGRAVGTPGADVAARFIASTCASMGLEPLQGRFLHPVPTARAVFDPQRTTVTVTNGVQRRKFASDSAFLPTGALVSTLVGFDGPAVFVGGRDDIVSGRSGSLVGKVAVTCASMLSAAAGDTLRVRGAVGIVNLVASDATREHLEWLRGVPPLYLRGTAVSSFFPPLPSIAAWPNLSAAIGTMARVESTATLPIDLNLHLAVDVTYKPREVESHNVACLLTGSAPQARDTAILFTAHYDHLGVWRPDETGDSLYNGFSDNAAGVAMLLAIGEALVAHEGRMSHSVVLLFPAGEEKGLLGSDFFVANPAWPLRKILGVINLDAGAPPARPQDWRIAGGDDSALGLLAVEVAADRGWSARTSRATPNSDYYPFWREGVPAIFIVPGEGPYEGRTVTESSELRRRWDRYHRPGDEWAAEFPFAGLARYAEFAYRIADALDRGNLPDRARQP